MHLELSFKLSQYIGRAGRLRNRWLIPDRCKTSSRAHPASLLLLYAPLSGANHLRFEAGSLTASFAEVQNVWYLNFTPTIRLRGVHRDITLPLFGPPLSAGYEGVNVLTVG